VYHNSNQFVSQNASEHLRKSIAKMHVALELNFIQ